MSSELPKFCLRCMRKRFQTPTRSPPGLPQSFPRCEHLRTFEMRGGAAAICIAASANPTNFGRAVHSLKSKAQPLEITPPTQLHLIPVPQIFPGHRFRFYSARALRVSMRFTSSIVGIDGLSTSRRDRHCPCALRTVHSREAIFRASAVQRQTHR